MIFRQAGEVVSDTGTSHEGKQSTAVITGGTRGIGFATATDLARRGFEVVVVGSRPETAQAAVTNASNEGLKITAVSCDITDPEAVGQICEEVSAGRVVDVLVNCAGVMSERTAKTLKTNSGEWRRVLSVNLDASFYFINSLVPAMVERRSGRVINVSACLGRFSGPGNTGGLAPYRISKSAVNAMTRNLAHELGMGSRGVLVDAVCPGHCRTDMGGPDAPRSAAEGADTIVWLATRQAVDEPGLVTGALWEDRNIVPW